MNVRVTPSQDGLQGVIRTCGEQTGSYGWHGLLSAVGSLLGFKLGRSFGSLSPAVLGGLLDMFAIVQSLPEDRVIHVSGSQGICVLCVWAHHVLGCSGIRTFIPA
ncbi:MAG: hypothetical protein FRX48_08116 [Lasallia pustulata]|uniref:Uncharacterized protein n=1 Tax=Lasallia pustulata TaxID=136370 RepID=A0A5M8PHV3_9LECA|nr:MAG: hypothetical protein FRX48_08116 [Lasallia pustulata]